MRRLIFTIVLLAVGFGIQAQPIDSLKKANEYYAADQIEQAINTYHFVIAEGYESAALYFNLGNAYYKNNDPINAILYFEKAKLLAPNDEDIQFNLDLVNQFVVDKIETLPRPFFVKWLHGIMDAMSDNGWAVFSLITFILTLIFALAYIFMQNVTLKKLGFGLAIVMLIFSSATFVFAREQKLKATAHNHAIVFSPSVTVKASPSDSSVDLFVVHEGLKVEIVKSLNVWTEIKLEDGNRGWVRQEILRVI